MRHLNIIILLATLTLAMSCGSPRTPAEVRSAHHTKSKGDIVVGFSGPWEMGSAPETAADAVKGVGLAQDEINASGGIGGRRLTIIRLSDGGSLETGYKVAQEFANNPDVCAIIGHESSYISIPLSIIYEYSGILMITPFSTNTRLTDKGFKRVFRCVPSDRHIGQRMALLCSQNKYTRVMIYHAENLNGRGIANAFESGCQTYGIDVPDRLSFSENSLTEMKKEMTFWRDNYTFDAIFVGADTIEAGDVIKIVRELGVKAALLGPESFDTSNLLENAGDSADGVFAASVFSPENKRDASRQFLDAFSRRYGCPPGSEAAQSYQALKVLAMAIEQAGSTDPVRIADVMRTIRWEGVTGPVSFDERGELETSHVIVKQVEDGKFVTLD